MLYAQMTDKAMWPMKWAKCEDMHKHLNRMTYNYQLSIEKRMLFDEFHPEFRAVLLRWTVERDIRKREILLETSDPEQMEAALFMLINDAEQAVKALNPSLVLPV